MSKIKDKEMPATLLRDPYWSSLLFIFIRVPGLKQFCTSNYIDVDNEMLNVKKIKKNSKYLSTGEKVLLELALHLFNSSHKFCLSDLDRLDNNNLILAYEAMKRRF